MQKELSGAQMGGHGGWTGMPGGQQRPPGAGGRRASVLPRTVLALRLPVQAHGVAGAPVSREELP